MLRRYVFESFVQQLTPASCDVRALYLVDRDVTRSDFKHPTDFRFWKKVLESVGFGIRHIPTARTRVSRHASDAVTNVGEWTD